MNGARRALDYRRNGAVLHRCSRCHAERELPTGRGLVGLDGKDLQQQQPFAAIMIGNELLGFTCSGCFGAIVQHTVGVFPDRIGFPLVDHHGRLMEHPRCDECKGALAYAADGRSVICPHCDAMTASAEDPV